MLSFTQPTSFQPIPPVESVDLRIRKMLGRSHLQANRLAEGVETFTGILADYPDDLEAILNVINWEAVNRNYTEALKSPLLVTIEKDTWKELAAFHVVMSQTFHPSEHGDLQPIRERSGEFLQRAVDLQKGKVPASFDTPEIHQAIDELVSGGTELNKMVQQKAGDKALAEIPIPAAQRVGWRVEEEFVNAVRGREPVSHTTFEDGVRYMEFTDAVSASAASGQAVAVKEL